MFYTQVFNTAGPYMHDHFSINDLAAQIHRITNSDAKSTPEPATVPFISRIRLDIIPDVRQYLKRLAALKLSRHAR